MGGAQTLDNYIDDTKKLQKHLDWINSLPSYILIDDYFISHGFDLPFYKRKDDEQYSKALANNRLLNSKYKSDWEEFSNYKKRIYLVIVILKK